MRTLEELESNCGVYCDQNSSTVNYTICTEDFYVDCEMYPKRIKELNVLVPMTITLLLIFLTGLVGNLSVCTVIKRHPNMRTETNCYLFSLAVSDILLLVFGLAPELWYYWQMYPYIFGDFTCRISKFLAATATWASALTVVAFSIERYTAICYQSSFRSRSKKHVAKALWAIWLVSAAMSVPVLYAYHVAGIVKYPPLGAGVKSQLSSKCMITDDKTYIYYYSNLYIFTCVLFFFIPMVILIIVYIRIGIFLSNNRKLARQSGIQNSCSENTKATKMMVAVVVIFFLCGLPFHLQRLITTSSVKNREYERTVLMVTGLFYYASAAANPILYNIWCKRYRKAFMEIISIRNKKQKRNIQMDTSPKNSDGYKKCTTNTTPTYTTQTSLLVK